MESDDITQPERAAIRGAVVSGDATCDHPLDVRTYLGHMGSAAFFQCTVCGGAVVTW